MSKIPTIQELKELDEQHCKMCDSQMSTNIKQLFNEIMLSHMKIRNNYRHDYIYLDNHDRIINGCSYDLSNKDVIEALDNEAQQYGYVYNPYHYSLVLNKNHERFQDGIQQRIVRNHTFCYDFFKSIDIKPTISDSPIVKNIQMNNKCQMSDFVQYMNKTYPSFLCFQ